MIHGVHAVIYSRDADADRKFFQDMMKPSSVDVGGGWLIFGLPPAELAFHPADEGGRHELYLMCHDVEAFVETMAARGVEAAPPVDQGWGILTSITLPSGLKLGAYEPRHASPSHAPAVVAKAKAPRSKARKAAKGVAGVAQGAGRSKAASGAHRTGSAKGSRRRALAKAGRAPGTKAGKSVPTAKGRGSPLAKRGKGSGSAKGGKL